MVASCDFMHPVALKFADVDESDGILDSGTRPPRQAKAAFS
jgi:hypothetical protein